jgi:YteA family regulatory protein
LDKLQRFKQQLQKMKDDLLEQTENTEGLQKHESLRDATQELTVVDNHPADIASENYERSKDLSLHEKNQLILKKIDEALEKIALGKFGFCENCGRTIPAERLSVVPYTEFCIDCKREAEGIVHDYPRPIEELNLLSPFARTFMDEKDYTGYDGEDAWQDVAQYNKLAHVHYEDVGESDETIGYVEDTDKISNKDYKEQLPD